MESKSYPGSAEQLPTPLPKISSWYLTILLSFYKLYPQTFDNSELRDFTQDYPLTKWDIFTRWTHELVEISPANSSKQT